MRDGMDRVVSRTANEYWLPRTVSNPGCQQAVFSGRAGRRLGADGASLRSRGQQWFVFGAGTGCRTARSRFPGEESQAAVSFLGATVAVSAKFQRIESTRSENTVSI